MQEKEAPPKAIAPEVGSVEKEPAEEEEKKAWKRRGEWEKWKETWEERWR